MFWALLLRNLLILSNKTRVKRLFQRSGSTGWLLSYDIAEGFIMGSVFFSMPWPWGIDILILIGCPAEDMFTPTSCVAIGVLQEGKELEDGNNAVDATWV